MRLSNPLSRWMPSSQHHSPSALIKRSVTSNAAGSAPAALSNDPQHGRPKLYGVTYVPPLKITRQHTKRGDYGLYDGLKVRAGDNVSKSKHRTKRTWKPNVQKTKLWSEVLGQSLQLRVTSAALKTIDRMGGLDRYVLQMSEQRLGGMGLRIRDLVIAAMQERVRLTKAFSRPVPPDQAWRIPRWQDACERTSHAAVRTMVPSLDTTRVTVFPRLATPNPDGSIDPNILHDFHVRGKKGSQTSRRSTHPRR
ncbi:hypothetical protein PTTG_00818 [Puccinia triticina 1-1 BBBD Race 1]|uniref:Large ribosomal subunit protein bL28c n=1 Tax=Puccinia triticina (isolate 1-1 / race 1 (BBBD)) TaxID=630390 RepID=A0A180H3J6_PUCT1|nr:hypothetical protein PTTG_00818 [Puccinia triticina 1-1 BBBD Race 1]